MSESPREYTFYGRPVKYDWHSVEHLLGKRSDASLARTLGCCQRAVSNVRRMLGIPRFRKADLIRPLLGRHPDRVVAELRGVARETVTRQRLAEGIPPAPRERRRDVVRAKHARRMAAMEDR